MNPYVVRLGEYSRSQRKEWVESTGFIPRWYLHTKMRVSIENLAPMMNGKFWPGSGDTVDLFFEREEDAAIARLMFT